MDVCHRAYLLVYSWVIAWVQYFRAPGNNGEAEGDQQLLQLLLCSVRCWKMLLFQVAEGTALAGPSPSQIEQGKVCCKDRRAVGLCRGCFPNRDHFAQDTGGGKTREQDRRVPRAGDRGDPIMALCVSFVGGPNERQKILVWTAVHFHEMYRIQVGAFPKDNCWKPAFTRTNQFPVMLLSVEDVACAWVGTFLQKAACLVEDRKVLVCCAWAPRVARFLLKLYIFWNTSNTCSGLSLIQRQSKLDELFTCSFLERFIPPWRWNNPE